MKNFENLFSPIKINGMTVKNRIFVPPMGTNNCTDRGEPTDGMVQYFGNLARGGAGLIVMEVADVDGKRRYNQLVLGIYDDFLIPGWKKLTAAIHEHGAKVIAQFIHAGTIPLINAPDQLGPVGASPVPHIYNQNRIPHELTVAEIQDIKKMFLAAARRAKEAGCDGVEVHCAHNHGLLGAFVSPLHNKRADEYGGSLFGRMKFPLEVIRAVREQVGPDYPISVRISGCEMEDGGNTIDDTCVMAKLFEEAGVNYFDVSNGTLLKVETVLPPTGTSKALNAEYAQKIKQAVGVPVGSVGRIKDPWTAEELIKTGKADIVFMGRALICDPDLPNKAKAGKTEDIRPCIGCSECVTSAMYGGATNCSLNFTIGHELECAIDKAETKKKVLIAGGGPGGLEAARVAALRGHMVTLMERSEKPGGQFSIAAFPPLKQELADGLRYQIREVKRLGVEIITGKEVTMQVVREFAPDAVIIATGGNPIMPAWLVKGAHKNVYTSWDALKGLETIGINILVIGGGQVGCETADYLAAPHNYRNLGGRQVTIVEMLDNIMVEDYSANRNMLVERLYRKNVTIITGAKVEEVLSDGIIYSIGGTKQTLKGIDTIIAAMGTHPENSLYNELKNAGIPVSLIGDAKEPRKIMQAVYEGAQAARQL
jgi:2,4-dienoyl-CoA reductase-like NADH-dependent reductase (Old Yellow Enzyme family)/thioredoxin reductase